MNDNKPAAPFAFADQELDFLIQESRKSVEGQPRIPEPTTDTNVLPLRVKRTHDDAIVPDYATAGAACFDLRACGEVQYDSYGNATVNTGLSFEVPEGYAMMIYSRSGHGFKYGVSLANRTGVIDSDYRGTVMVKLQADTAMGQDLLDNIQTGDRIAQAMLIPVPAVRLVEVDELSNTARGNGGFGSTGK